MPPSVHDFPPLLLGAWEKVKGSQRQAQTDWAIHGEASFIHYGEVPIANRNAVAVLSSGIGSLGDVSRKHN
jgi:hypothetical protein